MSSITTIIPLEIIEHILDIVAWSDRRTHYFKPGPDLKACSLSCKAFRRRSQQHVFRSVKVYHIDQSTRYPGHPRVPLASKFVEVMSSNPEIAEYVRELHYVIQNVQPDDTRVFPVPSALSRLRNLETLALYPESGEFRWKDLHSYWWSTLLDLLYLPSIVSIKLKLIRGFNQAELFPCTNLKKLHIQSVTLANIIQYSLFQEGSKPIRLREIEIDFSGALTFLEIIEDGIIDGKPLLNLKGVEKMTVTYRNSRDLSATEKLLGYTKNIETLHCIVVRFLDDVGPVFSSLSDALGSLKCLNLDVYIDSHKYEGDPLCGVPMGLQRIAGINRIETLTVRIQLSRETKVVPGRVFDWHPLEDVLLGAGWPSLRKFDLSIFSEAAKEKLWWWKHVVTLPSTQLLGLRSSTFLKFNFFAAAGTRISPGVVDQSMQLSF